MKCLRHRKDVISKCLWCGRVVCPECIVRKEGKKNYCEKCAITLAPYKIQEAHKPPEFIQPSEQRSEQTWTSKN